MTSRLSHSRPVKIDPKAYEALVGSIRADIDEIVFDGCWLCSVIDSGKSILKIAGNLNRMELSFNEGQSAYYFLIETDSDSTPGATQGMEESIKCTIVTGTSLGFKYVLDFKSSSDRSKGFLLKFAFKQCSSFNEAKGEVVDAHSFRTKWPVSGELSTASTTFLEVAGGYIKHALRMLKDAPRKQNEAK